MRILPLLMALSLPATAASGELVVTDPWVRAVPPGTTTTAAYMVLENRSDRPMMIKSIQSPRFKMIHLHNTKIESGLMKMQMLRHVVIKSGAKLELKPGGKHMMLTNQTSTFNVGDKIPIDVEFSNGGITRVVASVRKQ